MNNEDKKVTYKIGDKTVYIPESRQKDLLERYPDAKRMASFTLGDKIIHIPYERQKDFLDRYPDAKPLNTDGVEPSKKKVSTGVSSTQATSKDVSMASSNGSSQSGGRFVLDRQSTLYPKTEPAVRESTQTPLSNITEEEKRIRYPEGAIYRRDLEKDIDIDKIKKEEKKHDFALDKKTLYPQIEPAVRESTKTPHGAIPESVIEEELKKERFKKDLDEFNKLNLEAFHEIEKIKRNPDIIKNPEYLKYLKQLDDAITNKIEVLKSYKEEDVSDFTKRFPDDDISIWKSFYHATRRGLNNAKVAQILYDTDYNPTPEAISELAKLNAEDRFKGSMAYQKFVNAQTTMGRVIAFLENPVEVLTQLTIESQVALLSFGWVRIGTGMLVGARFRIPWVGVAMGVGLTSLGLERAGYIMEAFQEAGVDITNPDKLREAFENKELYDDIKKRALKKSVPVALFDFLSVLLAGRLFPKAPKGISKKALHIGGELAMQAGFGAGGEALGQYLADKRVRWPDVVTEALSELGGAPSEIAGGVTFRKRGMVKGLNILKSENKEAAAAAHKQAIDMQVTAGSMTPEQANQEMEGIKKTLDAEERIPEGTNNREELAVLLAVRDELIEMKNNSDPAFHKEIDEKIDKIAKDIERLKSAAPEEREQGSKGVESKPESDVYSSEDIDNFVERIKRGEKLDSPEDIQFYENNKKEIEKRLRESSKEEIGQTEPTPAVSTTQSEIDAKKADIERRRQEELDSKTVVKIENITVDTGDDLEVELKVITYKDGSVKMYTIFEKAKRYKEFSIKNIQDYLRFEFTEDAKGIIKREVVKDDFSDEESQKVYSSILRSVNEKYDAELKALEEQSKQLPQTEPTSAEATDVREGEVADEVINKQSKPYTQTEPTPTEATKPTEEEQVKQQLKDFGVSDKEVEATHGLLDRVFTGLKKAGLTTAKKLSDWVSIGKGKEKRSALKQIIGERGAEGIQTVKDNLAIAKQMEAEGKDPKTIFLATGWERDVKDKGKWKYDLPDIKMKDIDAFKLYEKLGRVTTVGHATTLDEIIDAEELFAAYPKLRNIRVFASAKIDGDAHYEKLNDDYAVIRLSTKSLTPTKSLLIHEIQHAIQDIEGFARGGSPDAMKIKDVMLEERDYTQTGYDNLLAAISNKDKSAEIYDPISGKWKTIPNTAFETWKVKLLEELNNIQEYLLNQGFLLDGYTRYQRLAGEVEARNAQRRAEMTPEQRKTTMISESELLDDVSPEDKIYLYGEGVQQNVNLPMFKEANAQFRIKNGQKIIEAIKDFDGSPEAVVALTHEIMHPTVVEIINGAKEGNEVGMKHAKTIVEEFNKANPDNKITIEQLIEDNDKFINGTTTDQYRAVQEFIAEAWERYHTEGAKGFSPEFQKVLEVIKEAFRAVYSAIKGEDISPELRKMFDEILGKETKESTAQFKLTELSEEERVKKQLETKESSQPSVVRVSSRFVEMPVKDINVDEKRFQNRTELDEEQLKNIIENWNENELDPVVLWKDEDGKTFLLAGHHRLEAAKQLGKEYIDARYFKGTEEEAIRYAKEKSNANRTMEQAFDRAKIYRKMREEGKSKKEIDKALEIEGKNKRFIERLSYLNPNGYAMQNLRSFSKAADRKTQKVIEGIAEWTGEVRKLNPELTNEHENEIYEYLYNNEKKSDKDPSKIKTMAEFVDLVNRRIHGLEEFNPDEPLNFEHKVGRGSNEALVVNEINKARAEIKKIKKEIATAQRTITNKELRDREIRDLTKQVIELEQKIGDLEKKRIRAIEADKQQLDIFAQINEQIKNGNITTEQVRQFEQRTEDQITESEPTVKSIESKAESTSKAELNEAVREADKFIEDETEDTGEDEARIETKPKKYAGKEQSPMEVSGGKPPQASEEMAKGSTKEVQEPSEQRGKERNEEIKEAAKRIADLIRKGKVSKPGGFSVQTPGSIVWDAAIEIAAQTIEAGGTMAQAVANGIKVIRESDWYKKLTEADKLRRESEFYDFVMNIPDDRDKNRRKRGFSKQFLNDTEIPDDIKNAISDEAIHYDRFPNKISLHTANAIYDELGAEKALLDMMNTSNGMPEAVRAMLGQVIIRRALEDGGAEYAVDLIKIAEEFLAKTATSFGQFNQALSLFQWLSPEGQVRYALRNEQIEINRRASKAKEDIDKKKKVLRNINKKVIDEVIGQHFSDTQLTQAVRKGLKDLGENIREIIRKHYTVYDNTKRTLTQKLIDEAGLTGEEAKYLADKVSEEFNRLATIEKQKALEKLRTIGQKLKQRKTKSLEDEIISLSNLGAFSDAEFLHIYAEKMGWKNIVDKDLENIRKLAERVQNEEEGFRRMRAVEDLLAYQANLGGIPFSELAQSVWYANILSGYKTHGINMLSNLSNLFLHYGVSVIRNPSDAAFLAKGMIYGFRRGIIEGKATWETGYSPISAKAEVPATLERRKFKSILYPLNAYKYVRRAMVAADVMFFEAAKEMRAYQFAKRIAVEQGKIDPSINQRQRALEIVGNTKEALAEATLQARQEYENRVAKIKADDKLSKSEKEALLKREKQDIKRRVFEILEKNRREVSPDIIPKSEDFGRRVTYNYTPEGLLGVGVAVVNEFTRKLPAAKYIIPFTNIIANVANEQINFSPLGFVRAARGGSITGNRKAPFDSDARNDMIVKAAIGTVSMAALYALSESDDDDDGESLIDITANGFNDYRKNYNLKETGWQPYSIRIGNKWISYQYTPLMLSLSFIGALRDAQKYRKEKFDEKLMAKTRVAATQVVHSFFDATYVSSIDQLINLIANTNSKDVAEDVAQFFSKSATSFIVPNLYNQVASDIMSIMDIPAKDIDSRFYAQILRNVPVARDIFMNKVNGLGEEVLIDNDRFISYAKPSPLWELITRNKETITVESYNAFNGHGVYDPVKNIVRVVTPEEYYKYNRMRGAIIKHTLQEYYNKRLPESEMNALINSGSLKPGTKPMTLQELPQEAFSEFLKSLKRDATEDAKWYLFNEKEFIKDWGYVERE